MPASYTMETLPEPLDPAVRLVAAPGETTAVLRFSGSTAPEAVAAKQGDLLRALQGSAWRPDGAVVAWFYDPPWTLPPFRRNEVAVPVVRRR
jgi:SOUL heme-binding protein